MIEFSKIKTDNVYARKLLETNELFLASIKDYIGAEVLVGSLAWGRNNAVGANSDIDLVIVYPSENRDRLLSSKYMKDSFTIEDVSYILGNKLADYLVAKISINGVAFSIDLIDVDFFRYMCTYDLTSAGRGVVSWKYGRYKQDNTYISKSFLGKTNPVTKISVKALSPLNKLQENIISRMRAERRVGKDRGSQYNILNLFIFKDRMDSDIQRMFDIS